MWTICYTEDGKDRWDRFFNRKELLAFLKDNPDIDDDALIFPPAADDLSYVPSDLT